MEECCELLSNGGKLAMFSNSTYVRKVANKIMFCHLPAYELYLQLHAQQLFCGHMLLSTMPKFHWMKVWIFFSICTLQLTVQINYFFFSLILTGSKKAEDWCWPKPPVPQSTWPLTGPRPLASITRSHRNDKYNPGSHNSAWALISLL